MLTPGNSRGQGLLDALGALADRLHREPALRAARRQRRIRTAVVAAQPAGLLVHGQARIALAARGDPAAGRAQQRRRVAAAVEEHQHLAVLGQVALDGQHRRGRHP